MTNKEINQNIYDASFGQLTSRNCPVDLADEASLIVAKDDPTKENLGRSDRDQEVINQVLPYLQ
jgi:hypothetical protein